MHSLTERLGSTSEEVRYMAVKDLSRIRETESVPLLLDAVGDKSYRVREEALRAICSFPAEEIFPRLEDFLRKGDNADLRTAAIEAFPRYGGEATPYLNGLLLDEDEEVRMFSAVILGEVIDPASVDPLIQALKDPDENVRHAAAETLGKIKDPRAVEPLIRCLEHDFWLQYPAVIALGNIGDPRAVAPLLGLLKNEMLTQAAIEALGKIGDLAVVPPLSEILTSKDAGLRNDVIAALVNIQNRVEKHAVADNACLPSIKKALDHQDLIDHLLASMQSRELETRKNAVIALGWLKQSRAVPDLIRLLHDYEIEEYVVGALVAIGAGAVPELISELERAEPRSVPSLLRCLGWIEDPQGIRACLNFLDSDDEEIRSQAIQAMTCRITDEQIEDALLAMLPDPELEITNQLIGIFGRSRSPRLTEKLLDELASDNLGRRIIAVRILGLLGDSRAFPRLRAMLEDRNDEVRAEVFKALSLIHPDKLTSDIIIAGLSDKSPTVRKAAAGSLAQINRSELEHNLILLLKDSDPEVRLAALDTLSRIGSASCVEHLIGAFAGGMKRMKMAIIRTMGNMRDNSSTQFLCDLIKDHDGEIKKVAIEALGQIGDRRAAPSLLVALDDNDWAIRAAAINALGVIGDKRSVPALLAKLEDDEDIIKKEAIVALAEIGASEAVNSILPLIHNENLQLDVVTALEKLGLTDFDFFQEFMGRANTRIRCLLVDLLGRFPEEKTVKLLGRILEDEFFTVRGQAARALGEIGGRQAVSHLLKAQKDDPSEEVRIEATRALKKMDPRR